MLGYDLKGRVMVITGSCTDVILTQVKTKYRRAEKFGQAWLDFVSTIVYIGS